MKDFANHTDNQVRLAVWMRFRTEHELEDYQLEKIADEFESGKLIILRTGGEVRIRSVDL